MNKTEFMILQDLLKEATAAHYGTSFSPEERGKRYIADYSAELEDDLGGMPEHQRERYEANYRKYFRAWLSSKANIVSSMIAGPSNFPTARMEKRNRWADNHYETFRGWRKKALKAIVRREKKENAPDPLEVARKELQRRKEWHEQMKQFNKEMAGTHEGWELSNNLQNIKRLELRVQELEAKAEKIGVEDSGEVKILGVAVNVVKNHDLDRLQLLFDGKPPQEVMNAVKKHGFKWSPRNKVWQRQLTPNAVRSLEYVKTLT